MFLFLFFAKSISVELFILFNWLICLLDISVCDYRCISQVTNNHCTHQVICSTASDWGWNSVRRFLPKRRILRGLLCGAGHVTHGQLQPPGQRLHRRAQWRRDSTWHAPRALSNGRVFWCFENSLVRSNRGELIKLFPIPLKYTSLANYLLLYYLF